MNFVDPIKSKENVSKIENYLKEKSKRNRLIFAMGVNVGLRISDILALNICYVYQKNFLEIREKKTSKFKRIFLNEKLRKLIREFLKNKPNSNKPLFVGKKGKRLNRSQVYRFLNEACDALNIYGNFGTHTLRKTFGYHHYKKFKNIVLLQKIFNHSSPAISLLYIGIDQEEIDNSYKNFVL